VSDLAAGIGLLTFTLTRSRFKHVRRQALGHRGRILGTSSSRGLRK
jgi:hypothetical protein